MKSSILTQKLKEVPLKILEGGGERSALLRLKNKKIVWNIFPNILQETCVIFFYSLSKYENLEWDFRGDRRSFLPQASTALVIKITKDNQSCCNWEIRARKGKRFVFTIEDMNFSFVVWWSTVRMVWYIRTPINIIPKIRILWLH